MPAATPDTSASGGIGIQEAQSQILALMDAEPGDTQDEQDESEAQNEGEADDAEDLPLDDDAEGEEPEAESDEDDTEEDATEQQVPVEVEIEIDGKPVKVGMDELKRGYLRQADYTRKTMALAEVRKTAEREVGEVTRERAAYSQLLTALEQQLREADAVPEPDWDALYARNPVEAMQYERKWQQERALRQQKRAAAQAEQQRVAEASQRLDAQNFAQYVQSQDAILADPVEGIPEWRDEKSKRRIRAELVEYCLNDLKLSPDEVRTLADARALRALYDSMKYRKALARKAASQQPALRAPSPTLRPGTATRPQAQDTEAKRLSSRLKQTGSVHDAAALLMRTLK